MTETNPDAAWPPPYFAVLQNGDQTPQYYRPIESGEPLDTFIDRIARTIAHGIVEYPYPAFVGIIEGRTGQPDDALTILVQESMERQRPY